MRGIIMWVVLFVLAAAVAWFILRHFDKPAPTPLETPHQQEPAKVTATRDGLHITVLDSLLDANPDLRRSPLVLIFFNPDCDHCQHEGEMIRDNIGMFNGSNMVFLSADSLKNIRHFAETYGLNKNPSVFLFHTSPSEVFRAMGPLSVPYLVVFGPDGAVRQRFDGVTSPGEIAAFIQ